MSDFDVVLTKSRDAAYRIYDGQATIVLPSGGRVNVLNESGSLVWEGIDGKRTLGEILERVLEEYDIEREQARKDILEFVAALREHGMVT